MSLILQTLIEQKQQLGINEALSYNYSSQICPTQQQILTSYSLALINKIITFHWTVSIRLLKSPGFMNQAASTFSIYKRFEVCCGVSKQVVGYLEEKTQSLSAPIEKETKQSLIPREKSSCTPKLFGQPKIHKADIHFNRQLAPTQNLAAFIAEYFQPLAEKIYLCIKSSFTLKERLSDFAISSSDILESLDLVSLFTNIPILDCLLYTSRCV